MKASKGQSPDIFKMMWWIFVLVLGCVYLYLRWGEISSGNMSDLDRAIGIATIALFLYPLYSEISLFGIKLMRRVEEISKQISSLSMELHNSQTSSMNFYLQPSHADLLDAKEYSSKISGVSKREEPNSDVLYMLTTNYEIESQIWQLFKKHGLGNERAARTGFARIAMLQEEGVLSYKLANAIRSAYAISGYVNLGIPISDMEIASVKEIAPKVISELHKLND